MIEKLIKAFGIPMATISLSLLLLCSFMLSGILRDNEPTAHATTSSNINFQARLLTSSGNTVPDGYYNIRFKLYDGGTQGGPGGTGQANAGSQLWTEQYYDSNGVTAGNDNRLRVVNGYVTVNLGSQSAFGSIDWDQELWLTMDIGGTTQTATPTYDGEMLGSVPAANSRLKLTAVPYAFKAGQLAKRTGSNTSTLDFATQTGARAILLPDESGTLCIQSSSNCGFALTSGSGNYIQNGTGVQTANFYVQSGAAGSIGGIVQGHTSQSADIFRAVTSSGTGLIVTSAGEVYETQRFSVASSNLANTVNSKLAIQPGVATTLGQVIRGFTAQSADLFQLQDSAGTILTSFDASGKLVFGPSGSQDTNLYRSAANTLKTDDDFLVGSNLTLSSGGNITQTGSTTLSTGTGSISLNGATTLSSTFSQTGSNTFSTGTGAISLNGATSVTGTNTLTVGTGLTSLGGQLDVTGSVAFKKGTDFSTTGTSNNINFGEVSLIRLTGASTQTITGIANGRDGEILTLVNSASQSATISNNSGSSSAGNQIITGTGANITLPAGGSITMVYDSVAGYWRVIGSVGFSTGNFIQNSTSLQTTANFNIQSAASGSVGAIIQGATSQSADLFQLKDGTGAILAAFDSAGRLVFGPSGSQDTNLYRSTANTLKTDDDLLVGNSLTFGASGGTITAGGTIAANGGSITTSASSFSIANANATTVNAFGAATTVNLGAAGVVIQGAGAVTLQAGGTNTSLTLQGNGTGAVSLGTTASAHSTTVGSTTSTSTTTIQAGTGSLILSPSGSSNTGVIVRPATSNSTAAFQIQNQAGTATLLNADTTNMRISIGSNGTATGQLYVAGSIPSSVSSLSTGSQNTDVYVQGRYAYVINFTLDTLQVIDISVPTSPVSVGSVSTGASTSPWRLFVQGRYAYVIDNSANSLQIYDVSNPASPTSVGSVSTATNPYDIYVQGRYVYISFFNSNPSMQIYDVSNPASPTLLSSGGSGGVPYGIFVQGRYAYITDFSADTLRIFDVSNPASPTSVGSVATTGLEPRDVYVQGRYAYVINDDVSDYLQIFDVSNPASPTSVGSLSVTGPAEVYVQGRYAYIAVSSGAFQVVDVSNPASPTSVGTYASGALTSIHPQGRYLYATESSNFRVYDLGGAYVQQLEAGGIETSTLTTNSNVSIGNNASIQGGLTVAGHSELSGNATIAGLLDTVGSVAFKKGTDFSTTGTTNNASFGDVSLVRLTGASAQTITGVAGGRDGEMLTIVNAAGQSATLSNATGSSAGNQIITGTGANITLPAGGTITLIYDSVAGYWRVTGSVAFSTGNYIQNGTSLQTTANFNIQSAASGSIGGIIRGASGQTERLLLFRDGTSGADLSAITADGSFIANSYATGTTATTSGTGTNTTTVTLTGSAFANNDVILIDNAGQDYYTRIVSGGGTSTLTVSPAVTFENARTVTKYNTQNIGSYTTDYSTQYRFFQGSFLGGIAVGSTAGTTLSDGILSTGLTTFNLLNTTATTVNAFGAATTINMGATGGATIQGGGALTLQSAAGTAVTLDSGTTGAVNIGNGANAKTIIMGSTSSTALNLRTGTSFSLDGVAGTTYDIGTSTTTGTVAIGGTAQTGTMTLGRSTATNTIDIGASAGNSNTQTINIGTSATASSTTNVTIGSLIGSSKVVLQAGTGGVQVGTSGTPTGQLYVSGKVPTGTVGSISTGAYPISLHVQNKYAYVVNETGNNLQVIDVSNPASPSITGSVAVTNTPYAVTVQGNYAYVIGVGATLQVIDISNPASPTVVGSATNGLAWSTTIRAQGRYVYIGVINGNIVVYDVANPTAPTLVTTLSAGDTLWDMQIQGRYLYTISQTSDIIQIVDIANPSAPSIVGSVSTGTSSNPRGLSVQGNYAYVVNEGTDDLVVIDISTPTSPSLVGTLATGTDPSYVYAQGRYVYVGNRGSNTIGVYDISNASSPSSVGTVSASSVNSIYAQGRYLYAALAGSVFYVYDMGGAYIQQLEAGGIETGTLNVNGNVSFASNATIQGGLTVGGDIQLAGDISVLGSASFINSGDVGEWQTASNALPAAKSSPNGVVANGYVYVLGGYTSGATNTVYYAKLNTDGSVGSWQTGNSLPVARYAGSAVTANGYIYSIGGTDAGSQSGVYYAKLNQDGSVGAWQTATSLPATRSRHDSIIANGYVYVIAGSFNDSVAGAVTTVYYAKLNTDGSIGAWATSNSIPAARLQGKATTANGYVYYTGGGDTSGVAQTNVYYARLNVDGSVGSWTTASNPMTARYDHTTLVSNGYMYIIGGNNSGAQSTVFYSKLASDGSVGSWSTSVNPLPGARDSHLSVVANGYLYAIANFGQTTVYYASTQRIKVGGSLDLVGNAGGSLADGEIGLGGELTAGNTNIVGNLDVRGRASFGNGLNVAGEVVIQSKIGADKSFTAQNASARSLFDISTPITNNVYNSTFETNNTIGWAVKGGTTISNSNTAGEFYNGARGFKITAAGSPAANDGAKYTTRLNPSTAYTLKFYAKASAGATANLDFGYSRDGSTDTSCLASSATFATSFTYYTCNFTTPTTVPSGATYIYVKQTDTTSRNIFIDDIYLETQSTPTLTLGEAGSAQLQTWGTTTAPTATLGAHTTVAYNGFIYAIGGYSGSGSDFQTAVNYARINSDGTLGTWSTTTALSPKLGRHASVVVNGYVYVIGGTSDNSTVLPTVNYAKLNSDGTISSWKTTTGLPEIRWDTAITSYNGYIYMVGGGDNVNAKNTTYYAKVNADGTITNWTSDSDTLPALNFGSSVVAANGYLYLTGGGNGSTANSGVYYTRLNADWSIGAWSTGNSLLTARFSHGSFVANGYLYVTGGATGVFGATAYGTTEYAKLNSDGTVGTWYSTTAMPGQRFFNGGVPVYNGYIYMVSGITGDFTTNGNYTNSTYYTSTQRIKFSGALDLVSLSGGNNQEGNGSGGELTAGNTNIVGNLQVTGQSNFMQGVAVAGASTFQGDINLTNQANNSPHTFSSTCDCSLNSAAGTFGSQTGRDAVTDSVVYKGKLFVAVRETDLAGVYRYDGGTTWTLVTNAVGKAVSADTANIDQYVLTVFNGKLFIGSQTGSSTGAVYSSTTADTTADSFTLLNATRGTFATANADGVSDLAVWNGYLYIGTQETNLAEIVRYDGGTTFTQVSGTDGQIDGIASVTVDGVALAVYEGRLFAGMKTAGSAARVAVYEGIGTTWTASTTTAGTIGAETGVDDITGLTVWNGSLYAATGETDLANIYRWQVAGNTSSTTATNWLKVNNASGKAISADTANIDGFVLRTYNGRLYAGSQTNATAGTTNTGAVYELDASTVTWSLLNGTRGTFGADTNVNNVTSLIEFNRNLYVGTDDSTNGVGAVYRYNKTSSSSYALNFSSTPGNTGSLSFVGDVQTSSAGAGTGAFVLSHGIMTTSGSYDVAEDYPTRDTTLKPGDLVSIDPNETGFVRRTNVKEDSTILGIYSEKPGLRLSQSGADLDGGTAVPVALAGRVPVNVTTENGPILPGDYLTSSSIPGFAMKATKPGPTIGKALEGFSSEGTGKIQTFVNVSYFSPNASNILQGSDSNGNAMTTIQGNLIISGDINIGGFATVSQLRVTGDAIFDGNLTVAKTLSTKNILVSGHIATSGDAPTLQILTPTITDPNTNQPQANPTVTIDGNDISGTIIITTVNGQPLQPGDLIKASFKSAYSKKPKIFLSPSNADSVNTKIFREVQNDYFIIKLVEGQLDPGKTYSFDYYVIE